MKRIPVDTLINKLTNLTNGFTEEVSKNIGKFSVEELSIQPSERSWSAIQCIEHLNAYYRYYIPVIRGKITNSRFAMPTEFFSSSPLGRAVYKSAKLGKVKNVKRKLKSPKDYNPLVNLSMSTEHSLKEYVKHNSDFIDLLKEASRIDMKKTKVPLSLRPVVKLNLGDALLFMVYHNERHIFQAKNALRVI
ncbi:MAG: DinB family protein [Crocinitomicaceae bacterium]